MTLSDEKKSLEDQLNNIKEGAIEALMEKESHISDLQQKIEEYTTHFKEVELSQISIQNERDSNAKIFTEMQDTILKKQAENEEKQKNLELEIDKRTQKRLEEQLKRNKEIEGSMQDELRKSDEKLIMFEKKYEEMEKKYKLNEEFYKRQVTTISTQLDELSFKRTYTDNDISEIEAKYQKKIQNMEKKLEEAHNTRYREIQMIESEKAS